MTIEEFLTIYLVVINTYGFLEMWFDKRRAEKITERTKETGKRRTPEKTLFTIALCGGSLGVYAGMYTFRHKTLKYRFSIGIPFIFLLNVFCVAYILKIL